MSAKVSKIMEIPGIEDDEKPAPARIPPWAQSIVDDVAGLQEVIKQGYVGVRKLQRSGAAWIIAIAAIVVLSVGFAGYVINDRVGDAQRDKDAAENAAQLKRDDADKERHRETLAALAANTDELRRMGARVDNVESTVEWIIQAIPGTKQRPRRKPDTTTSASPMFSPE